MIDRLAKIQLSIFAVITVITLSVMAIFYLRLAVLPSGHATPSA